MMNLFKNTSLKINDKENKKESTQCRQDAEDTEYQPTKEQLKHTSKDVNSQGSHNSSAFSSQENQKLSSTETHDIDHNSSPGLATIKHSKLAPYPTKISSLGLKQHVLLELLVKHIQFNSVLTLIELAKLLCISPSIVQELLDLCKRKAWVENYNAHTSKKAASEFDKGNEKQNQQMRYVLSHLGRAEAQKAFQRSGYLGPAPVPIGQYNDICKKQSSRQRVVTRDSLQQAFTKQTFSEELINHIGPSLNSKKPILIYGHAGTGKSYFCRHLNLVFGDAVLIPYAIEVNNDIIQVFDPEIHQVLPIEQTNTLMLDAHHDPRWLLCKRPLVVTGGELTLDMLDVRFDNNSKLYTAPLQLKANNGILLLDDLGRQNISPKALFNRWIIPLEESRDFLTLQAGLHFELPFELILLFSTNLAPSDLVDEAFLRRIGYKIEFEPLTEKQYRILWFQQCQQQRLECSDEIFTYLVTDLHERHQRHFLPCYPRDLQSIISDQIKFNQIELTITKELLNYAWHSYFVSET
ncbi:AAA family ATPase [Thalassotalea aquiviva]|uniref:AAA family ATPase n=1 Tax=Thalassotalea aquiviva TaxID=3242415 RepID=UPI00352B5C73